MQDPLFWAATTWKARPGDTGAWALRLPLVVLAPKQLCYFSHPASCYPSSLLGVVGNSLLAMVLSVWLVGLASVAFYSAIFSSSHSFPGCLGLRLLCTHAAVAPVLTCSTAISVRFRLFIMVFWGAIVSCGIWSMNFVRAMIIKWVNNLHCLIWFYVSIPW